MIALTQQDTVSSKRFTGPRHSNWAHMSMTRYECHARPVYIYTVPMQMLTQLETEGGQGSVYVCKLTRFQQHLGGADHPEVSTPFVLGA